MTNLILLLVNDNIFSNKKNPKKSIIIINSLNCFEMIFRLIQTLERI